MKQNNMSPMLKAAVALSLIASAAPVFAQTAAPAEAPKQRRFTLADFAQFAPVSALDMVQRVPGFSIERTDDRRGFGENAGNVLIDGDRPSTKTDDIQTILSRIPASQVEYVELVEGAGGDGEARGKGQIVNVIRKKGNRVSGTYEAGGQIGERAGTAPAAKGSVSFRRGRSTIDLNAGYVTENLQGRGPEAFYNGQRQLQEVRIYRGVGAYRGINVGGAIKSTFGAAKINANTRFEWNRGTDDRDGPIFGPTGARIGTETLTVLGPLDQFKYEFGGDIEFPLAAKLTTKIIGLWRSERTGSDISVNTVLSGRPDSFFRAITLDRSDEAIFRVQNDWTGIPGHAIQFGGEVVRNRLRAELAQSSITGGVPAPISPSLAVVRELRFEPFLSDVWTVSPKWKIEAGIVLEKSNLRLSGNSTASRNLFFWRPRLIASWTISPQTSLEFRAERDVSQLDFGDFANSVDVAAGQQQGAGNRDLVPQQADGLSVIARHKFMARGSIQLQLEHQWVKDFQELIPIIVRDPAGNITGRFDGIGNLPRGRYWNAELEIVLPFDWLTKGIGITGMEVKYVGHYHGSALVDPVTGLTRRKSGRPLWHQDWNFRHDVGASGFAWGVNIFARDDLNQFFVNQFRQERQNAYVGAFAEYKKFKLGTLRFEVIDLTRQRWNRDRLFYRDTRATGELIQIIERDRRLDRRFQMTLSGKF